MLFILLSYQFFTTCFTPLNMIKTKIKNLQQLYRDLDLLEQDLKAVNADLSEVREHKRKLWIELEKLKSLKH